jgi:carboxyl-terminal processing protease
MKISLKTFRNIILVLLLVGVSVGVGYGIGTKQWQKLPFAGNVGVLDRTIPEGKPPEFSLFWQTWDELHRLYVDKDKLDQTKLVYGAISGMVSAAGDPYTAFLPPEENKETKEDLSGSFGGVGIQLGFKDMTLAVVTPLSGTPAEKAGVKAGDLILKITDNNKNIDRDTTGISLPEAVSLIRGPKGTRVSLSLFRSGLEKPFSVELTRDMIVVATVETKYRSCTGTELQINKAKNNECVIPIIKVSRFGEQTDQEWDKAVEEVKSLSLRKPGIILDLRNNPGGFLDQAVNLASDFITSGPVVWQQGADGTKSSLSVTRTPRFASEKLVVLINEGSASAAEILAGALSEKAKAVLIGEKSFGKGSVQQPEDLPGGSGLHVTVARWLLPSQKSIDKVGIIPDLEVKMDEKDQTKDPQMEKAIEIITVDHSL